MLAPSCSARPRVTSDPRLDSCRVLTSSPSRVCQNARARLNQQWARLCVEAARGHASKVATSLCHFASHLPELQLNNQQLTCIIALSASAGMLDMLLCINQRCVKCSYHCVLNCADLEALQGESPKLHNPSCTDQNWQHHTSSSRPFQRWSSEALWDWCSRGCQLRCPDHSWK